MTRLSGRVALITGAGRGIGRAIALGYAREGADLILTSRSAGELEQAAEGVRAAGVEALVAPADVTDVAQVRALAQAAIQRFGRVDVLVNAAGIPMVAPTVDLALEDWQRAFDINMTGTFLCCQAIGRLMLEQGRGAIINIASLTSFVGFPQRAAYAATKGAVVQFTKALAVEWAPQGVRVNAIAPGWIRTALQDRLVAEGKLDRGPIIARTPARRLGEPDDIVGPAIFLASDEAAFVVGETLVVDGGWLAYGYV
jgi:NAD(P)-dependent dehydrogenase (short-subunit alcohol dehydrogenase family)